MFAYRLLFFALCFGYLRSSPSLAKPPEALPYERFQPHLQRNNLEDRIYKSLQITWGHRAESLLWDGRLQRGALFLQHAMRPYKHLQIPYQHLKQHLWQLGWSDGEVDILVLRLEKEQFNNKHQLSKQLATILQKEIPDLSANRIGVSVCDDLQAPQKVLAFMLFSKRLLYLLPLASIQKTNQRLQLRFVYHLPNADSKISLLRKDTENRIQEQSIYLNGIHNFKQNTLMFAFDTGFKPGTMQLEILEDKGEGPTLMALFPIGVEQSPFHSLGDNQQEDNQQWLVDHRIQTRHQLPMLACPKANLLWRLILGNRLAHGQSLPTAHPLLMQAAAARLQTIQEEQALHHRNQAHEDVSTLLYKLQQTHPTETQIPPLHYVWEDLGQAENVAAIFTDWLASPAHERILRTPTAQYMGIAVEQKTDQGSLQSVLLLGR